MKSEIISREKKVIDIETPKFFRSVDGQSYTGIIDEENIITFYSSPTGYKSYSSGKIAIMDSHVDIAIQSGEVVSELEFLTAHLDFIENLSLEPKLIELS